MEYCVGCVKLPCHHPSGGASRHGEAAHWPSSLARLVSHTEQLAIVHGGLKQRITRATLQCVDSTPQPPPRCCPRSASRSVLGRWPPAALPLAPRCTRPGPSSVTTRRESASNSQVHSCGGEGGWAEQQPLQTVRPLLRMHEQVRTVCTAAGVGASRHPQPPAHRFGHQQQPAVWRDQVQGIGGVPHHHAPHSAVLGVCRAGGGGQVGGECHS